MKNIEIFDPAMCCLTIVKTKSYPTNEEFSARLGVEISAKAQKKSGCCGQEQGKKQIVIDFLYLDLSVCKRCQGTETKLYDAINEVSSVLSEAGFEIVVNKININSRDLAIKHHFLSSPTIRVNGRDIALEVKESSCKECGDLCGDSVDCRVWVQDGIEYTEPPKSMIINAILKEVYGGHGPIPLSNEKYEIPQNLITFFDSLEKKED
jgi:hypothetical protein